MNKIIIKVPKSRIGAVIGKEGRTKKELEELCDCKIQVDSVTGDVEATSDKANPITIYKLGMLIKAIGRGFSAERAKLLLGDNITLNIINLRDLGIHTKKTAYTRRARVIGAQGNIRKFLEDSLDCFIAIQGKTISIIGDTKNIRICHEAIMRLLKGANISSIKRFIDKSRKNIKYISNTESDYIDFDKDEHKEMII